MTDSNTERHPKALYLLFFTEMWERFSYYGMRALLVIYVVTEIKNGGLGWTDKDAGHLWGIYTGLVYLTPLLGGYLADRYLGKRNAIMIGGLIMMLGHFALVFTSAGAFYLGLGLLIVGNGFFKPNISSMVGQLYPEGSPLKDSAYIIFHIGINLGSFFGVLLCGWLGENIGWHWGFGAAGIGMALGVVLFHFNQNMLQNIGLRPVKDQIDGIISAPVPKNIENDRLLVLLCLAFFSALFWMAYEQGGSSMSIFALKYTDRTIDVFDFTIPASWFQSVNPLFVFTLAPLMAVLWEYLSKKAKNPHPIYKFTIGLAFLAVSFALLSYASASIPQNAVSGEVPMLFWIAAMLLQTVGELAMYPIGLSLVNKLAPVKLSGIIFGAWLCSMAIGNYLSGVLASMMGEQSLSQFFLIPMYFSVGAAILLLAISKGLIKRTHGIN
ncbi:MAG: peptide MFS transporter [Cytophagales bacterium]